jgi:hypothetical protein
MATEPDEDELLLDDVAYEGDEPEPDEEAPEAEAETEEDEDEEVSVSFGDDEPQAPPGEDSPRYRELRQHARDLAKENARLKAAIPAEKTPEIGEKPTMESCEYNEDRYDAELLAWNNRKATAERQSAEQTRQREALETTWRGKLEDFGRKRDALKAPDFEDAESLVVGTLTPAQQTIIVHGADDSAKVVYALGRYPEKLKALAAIADPVAFAFAIAKLEGTIKVTTKRKAIEPETVVRGSAPLSKGVDKHMERLEREAAKTGDRTEIRKYRQQLAERKGARR